VPEVLLFRDIPEERRLSMERFADALEEGLAADRRLTTRSVTVHRGSVGERLRIPALDRYLPRFVRYPLLARRQRASVYHIVDQGYAELAAVLPRDRTVITCHDLFLLLAEEGLTEPRGGRLSVQRFRLSVSFLRRVARVVCVSAATRADVMRLCRVPEKRIAVVPNGIDALFRPFDRGTETRLKTGLVGEGRVVVLHVSSGVGYKNVPATLEVVAALARAGRPVALVRTGVPLSQDELSLARRLGVEESIIDCGRVSESRLVEIYNLSDVLLFPSFYEGFGWPPLEAMACGLPVVASNRGAIPEVVGEAGLLAGPDDIAGLARAVTEVLESADLRKTLRGKGLRRASEFTWQRAVDGYVRVYEEVLAQVSTRPVAPLARRR